MQITEAKLSDEEILTVFITGMEGGIGYWSIAESYRWMHLYDENDKAKPLDPDQVLVVLSDTEGDDFKMEELTPKKIQAGFMYVLNTYPHLINYDHGDLDIDANGADAIIQAGLFGTVVYG